jgi:uncharacterized membrane protein YgaE (UPF0421/DUF939 family)
MKTAMAVVISMMIVDAYGATTSKLIFAMLGAMAAVQQTFKDSLESCLTQIVGVFLGGLAGVLLVALPLPSLVAVGIGMILVITFYNAFRIRYSPSLPCFIVVMVCTSPEIQPMIYALGRIWDTAIGLGIGMLINTLIFPYDNSRRIHDTVESLDRELIMYLEDMFDGNDILPDAEDMVKKIDDIAQQLQLFANQKLLLKLKRQKKELETFRICENKARQLLAHMEVLCRLETLGRLSDDNRRRLQACGAEIRDDRVLNSVMEKDVVTNYHVEQILILRRELLNVLNR